MKHISLFIHVMLGLLLLLPTACTQDDLTQQGNYGFDKNKMSFQLEPAHMGIYKASRGSDAKDGAEQEIKNAHVFIFDSDGNYLLPKGSDAFQGYDYITDKRIFAFASDLYGNQAAAQTATVVAVANVPADEFGETTGGRPANIKTLSDLGQHVFTLPTFTTQLPETGLPMVCIQENVDLSNDAEDKIKILNMRSMMARIDFNFTMDPFEESPSGNAPSLEIESIHVGGFPTGGTIKPQLEGTDSITSGIETTGTPDEAIEVTESELLHETISKNVPASGTFYIFEHGRAAKDYIYPDSITATEIQRLKNDRAADDAAFIRFSGVYTNHNNHPYNVDYTIYPGGNPDYNFTMKTNCQYKNNVTITGITVNKLNPDKGALLDTRVNIDTDVNAYFIEMLRERKHDAHFNVTPMDVYIDREVSKNGTVTIEIDTANTHEWIRMEPMRYSPTANGKEAATEAGQGKRKYFTTDLLKELDQNEWSTRYTVGKNGEREERIYFYIDENIPKADRSNLDANNNVVSRNATITITFDPDPTREGDERSRNFSIGQAGMRAVNFTKFINDGDHRRGPYTFWIEEYEEYLEHYDGKNEYSDAYEGLEWGLDGITTGAGSQGQWQDRLDYGWRNTMDLMKAQRQHVSGPADITLNDKPRSAAEYCYNKNKRNENGEVEEVHWYLPTISECEYALEAWYGTFSVFQDKWYWSCNPGPSYRKNPISNNQIPIVDAGSDIGEHPDYARATKITYKGGQYVHVNSQSDWPYNAHYPLYTNYNRGQGYPRTGGYAMRKEQFRIRAIYIDKAPEGQYRYQEWYQWKIVYYDVPSLNNSDNY